MLTRLDGGLYVLDKGFAKDDADQVSEGLDIIKMMVGRIKNMVLEILDGLVKSQFPDGFEKSSRSRLANPEE